MKENSQLTKPAIVMLLLVLHANLVYAGLSKSSQLKLDVAIDKPVLLADSKQNAYLRVGLTGFALETDQQRAPVNIALVIDKSGSMEGKPLEYVKSNA